MTSIRRAALATCLCYLTLGTSAAAQGQSPDANYYPLALGNSWTYWGAGSKKKGKIFIEVIKAETVNDAQWFTLDGHFHGRYIGSEILRVTKDGIFRHRAGGEDLDPPLPVLKFPVKDGDRWEWHGWVKGQSVKVITSVKLEEIKSDDGTHHIAIVDATIKSKRGIRIPARAWYVPNVGMTKMVMNVGLETVVAKLQEFEPATVNASQK